MALLLPERKVPVCKAQTYRGLIKCYNDMRFVVELQQSDRQQVLDYFEEQ